MCFRLWPALLLCLCAWYVHTRLTAHPCPILHPLRERLMPLRSWVQRSVPGMLALTRRGVEHPGVGVPGVCNFVDGELLCPPGCSGYGMLECAGRVQLLWSASAEQS